ncbi:multidrug transporter [Sphingorhabdus lutea]|uniref:Multidrug transporter n=1 Tax=Sphingorhabdus lutea TaxID=1913578 RepID=A0A1L3JAV9_9SPHN|nr:SapC family protein [Sphingorhabdus lutea]APG62267.1 multidrug transporter [Sphingorhabdus lutea]
MATAAPANNLPLLYKDLMPLNSNEHGKYRTKTFDDAKFMEGHHAIPLTIDEFAQAGRHYPIIFSDSENPVPLVLMGMNEGVNTFMDADGKFTSPVYIPAYIRRYPFLLAKLSPESEELSLCFDPTSDGIGAYETGDTLFEDGKPTETTKNILKFCEDFETAGARTQSFVEEIKKLGLLMDGEVAIQQEGREQPFVYRGFKMIDEEKLREMRGDELRKINQNGLLPLLYAHLFSLQLMRDLFAAQVAQGKAPQVTEAPAA